MIKTYKQFQKDRANNQLNGIYKDVPNDEYRSSKGLSRSDLTPLEHSYAHFLNRDSKKTRSKDFGSYFHSLILTPEEIAENYVYEPKKLRDISKNTKLYKSFKAYITEYGLELVSKVDKRKASLMREALQKSQFFSSFLSDKDVYAELSIYFTDEKTGLLCKIRPDLLNIKTGHILDLKTSSKILTEHNIVRSIGDFGYHYQAGFYCNGIKKVLGLDEMPSFSFTFIETLAPHGVKNRTLDYRSVEFGIDKMRDFLFLAKDFYASKGDLFLGYSDEPETISIPNYLMDPAA